MALGIIKTLSINQKEFPVLLKEIPKPPSLIYLKGELPPANLACLAIVGTRKATSDGKTFAKRLAFELAQNGFVIVSGLAFGIDTAAHQGALAANGQTIAVVANGLDSIYPRSNEQLAKQILANNGAIISEYPPGTPAYPNQFLERNRIISGLSIATIIVEAPIRSGALVTARYALEQGREVFVAPGSCLHQNYRGSHLLIRNGARLISSAEDVIEDIKEIIVNYPFYTFNFNQSKTSEKINQVENEVDKIIIENLKKCKEGLEVDKIIELTKLETHIVNQHLTFLLFEGLIIEKNGKYKINNC